MFVYVCLCLFMFVYVCICLFMFVYVCLYLFTFIISDILRVDVFEARIVFSGQTSSHSRNSLLKQGNRLEITPL